MKKKDLSVAQPIFLCDGSILPWERPVEEGSISMLHTFNGSTNMIESLGLEALDQVVGPFRIVASAAKYLTDLARLDPRDKWRDGTKVTGKVNREVLFSGGITIYREGVIPGTKINGYDLECEGTIWVAKTPVEQFNVLGGLQQLTLTSTPNNNPIEAIIVDYKKRESAQHERVSSERYDAFLTGQEDARGCRG